MDRLDREESLLNDACAEFLAHLHRKFEPQRQALLALRTQRQNAIDQGRMPDFLDESQDIRQGNWKAAPIPEILQDRRVEITGPVERKMVINGLNSGARVFMADFEDSNAPTWPNCIAGQANLFDAVRGTIAYQAPNNSKRYTLNDETAVLMVRPRGWHLNEVHYTVDDQPISASLFDFAVFVFHNAPYQIKRNQGPFFYLPKLESHQEAQLWESVIGEAERYLQLPDNVVKVTVLIETITAVFEMDEIIYALKNRITGLNCGRWDYIFSFIKKLSHHTAFVLPDRAQVLMTVPFLRTYVDQLVYTCHKRGIHAMGGMAAQIPIKGDSKANDTALAKVREDKLREVKAGHDGTWVAHPGLIPIALEVFNEYMPEANQIAKTRQVPEAGAQDFLLVPKGSISADSVQNNIRVALQYLTAWLGGNGCVPIDGLMEDAATAEICRAQLWQWLRYEVVLEDGRKLSASFMRETFSQELARIEKNLQPALKKHHLQQASTLLEKMIFDASFTEFLTLEAYPILNTNRSEQ